MRPPATSRCLSLPTVLVSVLLHGIGIAVALHLPQATWSTADWRATTPHRLDSAIVWDCPVGPERASEAPLLAVVEETSPPEPLRDPPEPSVDPPAAARDGPIAIEATPRRSVHLQDAQEWRTPLRGREATTSAPQPTATALSEAIESPAPPAEIGEVAPSPLPGQNEPPRYPFAAWRRGIQGTVVIELSIDATGIVTAVRVDRSSGCLALDEAARTQLLRWRFTPARGPAGAVPTKHRQAVVFRIQG